MEQVKENNNNKYIHVISLVNNNYIIIDKSIEKRKDKKTNIKKNKQKEIRNRKGKRNLDRIVQKLRNIKGIKLRMGNMETKDDENKRIKVKMIR